MIELLIFGQPNQIVQRLVRQLAELTSDREQRAYLFSRGAHELLDDDKTIRIETGTWGRSVCFDIVMWSDGRNRGVAAMRCGDESPEPWVRVSTDQLVPAVVMERILIAAGYRDLKRADAYMRFVSASNEVTSSGVYRVHYPCSGHGRWKHDRSYEVRLVVDAETSRVSILELEVASAALCPPVP
ncbi:MAG: hypothetical protein A2848_01515 [Candidatus Magasanikbacteria bacterium RIFCSPHIGHO2_01_FULL_50_8]|uniref:Uncharacterized protein n=1 Tax=Candidatus Magasanikbacteria bacterium RIFCSPHIGHO2_01_FULL_50_8 TaxID=1798674 RepID=A0A1F6LRW8_9BACT|nr:MAG: hypothetical protein A2848_01515 [Candidatus Magasanikbacteria bacterium RIFCSPHIGHO2_01_FULL_50_8]